MSDMKELLGQLRRMGPTGQALAAEAEEKSAVAATRPEIASRRAQVIQEQAELESQRPALRAEVQAREADLQVAAEALQQANLRRLANDSRYGGLSFTKTQLERELLRTAPPELKELHRFAVGASRQHLSRADQVAGLRSAIAQLEELALSPEVDLAAVEAIRERLAALDLNSEAS